MVNRKTLAIAGYISLVLVSICLGRMTVPTVGRVEKPVEVIKYLPAPVLQQATTPFGMTEECAYRYRGCPNIITTYAIVGENHTAHSMGYYLEREWPNFGIVIHEEDLGKTINEDSRVIKLTIQKNACWS